MKTILEWYEELPDGIRERAIQNCRPRNENDIVDTLYDAITTGFNWDESPEETPEHELFIEKDFWYRLYQEAERTGRVEYQERAKLSKHKAVRTPMFLGLEI